MAIMYHLGIMQRLVYYVALVMQKTMKTSGAESLSAAANIFVGQTEAPLVIKPYVEKMTYSELCCVMTGGMATIAGGVMAGYVSMLKDTIPGIAGHLVAASVMSAPAAMVFAKMLVPETEVPVTSGNLELRMKDTRTLSTPRPEAVRRHEPGAQRRCHAYRLHRSYRHGDHLWGMFANSWV